DLSKFDPELKAALDKALARAEKRANIEFDKIGREAEEVGEIIGKNLGDGFDKGAQSIKKSNAEVKKEIEDTGAAVLGVLAALQAGGGLATVALATLPGVLLSGAAAATVLKLATSGVGDAL